MSSTASYDYNTIIDELIAADRAYQEELDEDAAIQERRLLAWQKVLYTIGKIALIGATAASAFIY